MFDSRVNLTRLEEEVQEYEKAPIETGKIMFYGDSGFTRWSTNYEIRPLEEEILGKDGKKAVINHGIGGSTAEELLFYFHRLVVPWKPKALVLLCFGNDNHFGYSPVEILYLQSKIIEYARALIPGIRFYLCDVRVLTVNIDNEQAWGSFINRAKEYNALLEDFCNKNEDCTLVTHCDCPLFFPDANDVGEYRNVRRDIFVDDQVHFDQNGYTLYAEFFRNILDDIL